VKQGSVRTALARLGLARPGFLTPYKYLSSVSWEVPDYPEVRALLEAHRADFSAFLARITANEARFVAMAGGRPRPDWASNFISPLDGAAIYTGVAAFRPARLIEIGSGNSTFFMARAVLDHATGTEITCIDPKPRIDISGLPVRFERRVLSEADLALTDRLGAGDVLFVDSSHILQQGFDLDIILNRILPRLASGVIVHFHDIFLPYGYPSAWEKFRFNEQNALIGWLLSGALAPIFASNFACRDMASEVAQLCPGFPTIGASGGASLWVRKA
jgi:predicted O-methyltransferase YrrM